MRIPQTHRTSRKYPQHWRGQRERERGHDAAAEGKNVFKPSHPVSRCLDTLSVSPPPSPPFVRCVFPNTDCPGGANLPPAESRCPPTGGRSALDRWEKGKEGENAVLPSESGRCNSRLFCSSPSISFVPSSLVSCENARPEEPADGGGGRRDPQGALVRVVT